MKTMFLISTISILAHTICFSQISKGSLFLGGDLSGYLQKQEAVSGTEYKSHSFLISPLIGYATRQNIVQGGYLQIGVTNIQSNTNPGKSKTSNFGAGYFIRKYSGISKNFFGFIQGNAGVMLYKNKYELLPTVNENKSTTFSLYVNPGLSYRISKKLHLETGLRELASLRYQVNKDILTNPPSNSVLKSSQLSFSSSLNNFSSNLYFGFRLILDKKAT